MNLFVQVPDDGCLFSCFDTFLREKSNRPALHEILGAACELYRVDPDEIQQPRALSAVRAYCYLAGYWSREPFVSIGALVGMDSSAASRASHFICFSKDRSEVLRDDLDLLALRVAERVLIRKRLAKNDQRKARSYPAHA